ncbi:hypothetical protein BDV33DRAFT_207555 [Aspergillus novoparasiticus]|uniref:SMP-30/Gluconolactonase/LRE-like region domain-containing protein n=1 Tax=Aspergillus novoparasiticus TaxID=986946 RepID=A0A5N6EHK7_9EURO|nr:hypothetical protein BDV33DRAFT_207555 [Aspergillus novoparasiticus]
MISHIVFFFASLLAASLGISLNINSSNLREVYQFPNGTWVENIAVRSNGNLLVTLVNVPEAWEVSPSAQPGASGARLVHHFINEEMATGITELSPDVFALITPNTVWKLDLNEGREASPVRVATLPAGNLNGMATLDQELGKVAISDSEAGLVWGLDTHTGKFTVILRDETMMANTKEGPLLGINGLKVHGGYVYYVNTPERIFCRIPISTTTGHALGAPEAITKGVLVDDFAISPQSVAYLAGLRDNVVTRVFMNGTREVVAGHRNSTALMSATSVAFGRKRGIGALYITTGGETDHPVDNSRSRGGKVMELLLDV